MTNPQAQFDENFRPTEAQIEAAVKFTKRYGIECVFMPVNFPGKQRGVWVDGQAREEVRDEEGLVFRITRDAGLFALLSGESGNALFRVWEDGHVNLVDEA